MRKQSQQVTEILHTHRNQARYFAVFLMLSALVISFVCSALMMPAVSMQNNGGISVQTGNGYPSTSGTYEDSTWYTGGPLGVAGDFHMFAFEDLVLNQHLNGNFAAKNLYITGTAGAIGPNNDISERMLSVATNSISLIGSVSSQVQIKLTDFYVPETITITQPSYQTNPNQYVLSPLKQYEPILFAWGTTLAADTSKVITEESSQLFEMKRINNQCDVRYTTSDYIDFATYKTQYENLSAAYTKLTPNVTLTNNTISLPDSSVQSHNVAFLTAADFASTGDSFVIKDVDYSDGQFQNQIILNVDLAGETDFNFKKSIKFTRKGSSEEISNDAEDSLYKGTNILWNFYDSSKSDGIYRGIIHNSQIVNGQFLAPGADVRFLVTFNGNAIANKINISMETHRADFNRPIQKVNKISVTAKKVWVTGTTKATDAVKVQLYQSIIPRLSGAAIKTGGTLFADSSGITEFELTKAGGWTYEWADLPNHDNNGNSYYYYVVEESVPEGYEVEYANNGVGKANGTVTIINRDKSVPTTTTSTTTTQTTTTTTVQTTTTTAPATTTTAAATTTQGIRIGIHKVWSDLATNSHDSDTVVVEIHRSTNPTDVPDQMKITTTAVTTTTAATVTTTGKSPPSGADQSGSISYNGSEQGIPINGGNDTEITSIVFTINSITNGNQIHFNFQNSAQSGEWDHMGSLFVQTYTGSLVISDPKNCSVSLNGNQITITNFSGSICRFTLFSSPLSAEIDYTITYASGTSGQGMDSIKPVLAANGSSSPTWVQNLEIRKDTSWTATAENLPATDADGNPYYYWAVEKDFSGYDASYLYENSPGDKYITGKDGSITVCNTPSKTTGVVMPSTGGSGTFTYRLIGISLMTAAAGLFVLRRQKQFRSSA